MKYNKNFKNGIKQKGPQSHCPPVAEILPVKCKTHTSNK
jgi:hypothetical protein